jgi:prepilin-type N-terminal cleavage/methylation domain-containing protein
MCQRGSRGNTLIECLVTLAVLGVLVMIVVPDLDTVSRRRALYLAAEEVRQHLESAKQRAEMVGANCGAVFARRGEGWVVSLYADGDGDGVQNADIADGTDRRIAGPFPLLSRPNRIAVGIGDGFTDPDTLQPIAPGTSPVAFNRSFICSFSPNGNGTPGSVYLTDGNTVGAAVRCSGSGGNIRKLYYQSPGKAWIER